ncbi:hypothetical protein Riv7116_5522 [Rivularia sp. PCC 7116]|nr:hypothetical protein Riv7116_5522 [Rivularia sp. PCC 7116]
MDIKELLERIAKGEKDFVGIDLSKRILISWCVTVIPNCFFALYKLT